MDLPVPRWPSVLYHWLSSRQLVATALIPDTQIDTRHTPFRPPETSFNTNSDTLACDRTRNHGTSAYPTTQHNGSLARLLLRTTKLGMQGDTMRGRELKPLMLPQLVEARGKEGGDVTMDSPNSTPLGNHLSRSSIMSEYPSPTTPTFSLRGHSRLPSSNSSAPSSPNMRESIEAYGSASRPLTDVKEEPLDKDEDYEMVNGIEDNRISEGNWKSSPCPTQALSI